MQLFILFHFSCNATTALYMHFYEGRAREVIPIALARQPLIVINYHTHHQNALVMSICKDWFWNSLITLSCFVGAICWNKARLETYKNEYTVCVKQTKTKHPHTKLNNCSWYKSIGYIHIAVTALVAPSAPVKLNRCFVETLKKLSQYFRNYQSMKGLVVS